MTTKPGFAEVFQPPTDIAVGVASVAEFLLRYYKPERYTGRGADYAAGLLASYSAELKRDGQCYISRHDSVTGNEVVYSEAAK